MQMASDDDIQPVEQPVKPASDDGMFFPEFYCFKVDVARDLIRKEDEMSKSLDFLQQPMPHVFEIPEYLNEIEFPEPIQEQPIPLHSQPKTATEIADSQQQGTGDHKITDVIQVEPPKDFTVYREPVYFLPPDPPIYIDCTELIDCITRFEFRYGVSNSGFGLSRNMREAALSSMPLSESDGAKIERISTVAEAKDELDFETCAIEIDPLETKKAVILHWLDCVNGDSVFKHLNLEVVEDSSIPLGTGTHEYRKLFLLLTSSRKTPARSAAKKEAGSQIPKSVGNQEPD